MSKSDIHGYITFGWVATIVGLLLFGALGNSYLSSKHQSSYYIAKCAEKHSDSPFATSYFMPADNEKKSKDSDGEFPNQPDWCDLAAQQSVAENTVGLHLAAWSGVLSGFAGIILLILNLAESRAVSVAAIESNALTRLEQRPWVTLRRDIAAHFIVNEIEKPFGEYTHHATLAWNYYLENVGKTPAFGSTVETDIFPAKSIHEGLAAFEKFAKKTSVKTIEGDHCIFQGEKLDYDKNYSARLISIPTDFDPYFFLFVSLIYRSHDGTICGYEGRCLSIGFDKNFVGPWSANLLEHSKNRRMT
jgi:hypothetical protein